MSIKGIWRGKSRFETITFSLASEASEADYKSPDELKQQYSSASILKNSRVVFNSCDTK
jgi:mRNA interferase HigB